MQQRFAAGTTAALVGVPLGDDQVGYTNSAAGFSPGPTGQLVYRYDKQHLVPFGEFIPTGFRWFTQMMDIPLGDFNRGPLVAPSFVVKGERIAPNICYEDLFGEELAARFADAASAPTILANLSNIGWFGETIAVAQHLQISRLRSLELQRPMLRATNTGATVVIDHRGPRDARTRAAHARRAGGACRRPRGVDAVRALGGRLRPVPLWLLGALLVAGFAWRRERALSARPAGPPGSGDPAAPA